VYRKILNALVLQGGVAPSYGYSNIYLNGGKFTNEGIELSFQATPIETRSGFNWTTTNTYYRNYSNVNSIPVPNFVAGLNFGFGADYIAPGRSLTEIANTLQTGPVSHLYVQTGDFSAGGYLSFGNEFNYKGFRVFGLVDWSLGGQTVNLTDLYFDTGSHLYPDSAKSVNRLAANGPPQNLQPYVETAQFFKVREIEISYTLPGKTVNTIGAGRLTNVRLAVTAYNFWSIFGYGGLDPEVTAFGNQAVGRGYDVTPYPPSRSIYFGLNLGL
jgi:TonB-dependent starch-binding outer membrane protein SusC